MAQILKLPVQSRPGLVTGALKTRAARAQISWTCSLVQTAQILDFASELAPFEQALLFDERGDERATELYLKAIDQQDCVADAFCNLGIIESQGEYDESFRLLHHLAQA